MEIVLHALNGVLTIMLMILLFRAQGLVQRGECGAYFTARELCLPAYIYADQYFGAV